MDFDGDPDEGEAGAFSMEGCSSPTMFESCDPVPAGHVQTHAPNISSYLMLPQVNAKIHKEESQPLMNCCNCRCWTNTRTTGGRSSGTEIYILYSSVIKMRKALIPVRAWSAWEGATVCTNCMTSTSDVRRTDFYLQSQVYTMQVINSFVKTKDVLSKPHEIAVYFWSEFPHIKCTSVPCCHAKTEFKLPDIPETAGKGRRLFNPTVSADLKYM